MMDLYRYTPNEEMDNILLEWRHTMATDGDLAHTLSASVRSPSTFLQFFASRPLVFTVDQFYNITHAAWVELCMGSVFLSYYVSRGARSRQKDKLDFLYNMIDLCFQEGANSIVGIIQERDTPKATETIIDIHKRLGYIYAGRLPKFFDGKTAHLVSMTADMWRANDGRLKRNWSKRRAEQHTRVAVSTGSASGIDADTESSAGLDRATAIGTSLAVS